MDSREAASYLRVSYQFLMQLAREGKIECFRPGKSGKNARYRFHRDGLDRWMTGAKA
jgi:excisionase family DNA binding protein